jgi:hypothetical protein
MTHAIVRFIARKHTPIWGISAFRGDASAVSVEFLGSCPRGLVDGNLVM